MKVLLIEDDEIIAKGLKYSFEQNGYDIICKTTKKDASWFLQTDIADFVILDINLPDGNGFELYKENVKDLNLPTIFLTARDDENDIVKGLELGADDYLTKPFSTKELMARIKKIMLRENKNVCIDVADISFNTDKLEVYKGKQRLELTSLEIKILQLLFNNLNKVVTRNEIIDRIWEWTGNDVNDNTVTVYLKRIREKIGTDIIITIKGVGYRIDKIEGN